MIELDRQMIETAMTMRRRLRAYGREAPPLSDPALLPWLLEQAGSVPDAELQRLAGVLRAQLPDAEPETSGQTAQRRYRGVALPEQAAAEVAPSEGTTRTKSLRVYRGRPLP